MINSMMDSKTIWEKYGKYILLGLLLLGIAFGGWQFYSHQKMQGLVEASMQYDKMMRAFQSKDTPRAEELAQLLIEKHNGTPYAAFAALLQARIQIDQNQFSKAEEYFNTAIQLGGEGPAAHVARVRLARVLVAEKKLDAALKILSYQDNEGYVALYEETKGDIYMLQKNVDKARAAYKTAEQALPPGVQVMSLQLKQNDLNRGDLNNQAANSSDLNNSDLNANDLNSNHSSSNHSNGNNLNGRHANNKIVNNKEGS